jgi:hypothetical protein
MSILKLTVRNFSGSCLQQMSFEGNVNSPSGGMPVFIQNGEKCGPILLKTGGAFAFEFSYMLGDGTNIEPFSGGKKSNIYKVSIYSDKEGHVDADWIVPSDPVISDYPQTKRREVFPRTVSFSTGKTANNISIIVDLH